MVRIYPPGVTGAEAGFLTSLLVDTPDIWQLSDNLVEELAELSPVEATFAGVGGHDGEWTDYSPEGLEGRADYFRSLRGRITNIAEPQDQWGRRAWRVASEFAQSQLDWAEDDERYRQLRVLAAPLDDVRSIFDVMEPETAEGRANMISRLRTVSDVVTGIKETLELGLERGLPSTRRQVAAVSEQCATHAGPDSAFRQIPRRMAENGAASSEVEAANDAAGAAAQTFGEIGAWLESTYMAQAVEKDPVGRERYERASYHFLGMHVDQNETYSWGWDQIEKIRSNMELLAGEIEPGATRHEAIELLNSDRSRMAHRDEFAAAMQDRQAGALSELSGSHFDIPGPVRSVETKLAPPGSSLGAYYVGPSEDFSRIGSVWFSVGDNEYIPVWENVTTAYHEGFPGHHLQVGIQLSQLEHSSRLQRVWTWNSGGGEGWALYAERLMHELGYFEKPELVFGMLAASMMRACRVAIDIGSHLELPIPEGQPFHPGEPWTFDTAVEMMQDYAGQLPDYAASEVTRYLGWPGQAPSYKIGERVILELREEMKRRRGPEFDLKQFHSDVLEAGAVGLELLREFVLE